MIQCTTDKRVRTLSVMMKETEKSQPGNKVSHQRHFNTILAKILLNKAGDPSFLSLEPTEGLHPQPFPCHHNREKRQLANGEKALVLQALALQDLVLQALVLQVLVLQAIVLQASAL